MATWLQHAKLQFGGPLGAGVDEWSNTVRIKINADRSGNVGSIALTADQCNAGLEALESDLKLWFAKAATGIYAGTTMTWAKLNMVGTDGKQLDRQTHYREWAPVNGGGSGQQPPWFVTVALTMRTDYKRGRAHSGRIFPPCISVAPQAGSTYIPVADANAMATSWAVALDGICTAIGADTALPPGNGVYPVIASPATAVGPDPGGPVLLPVTGIVVDRVPDVQHRRTNRVPRSESARAVVSGD